MKGLDGYYHTAEETFFRIWNSGGENPTAWYVRTKDGTLYTFSQALWQVVYTRPPQPPSWDHQRYKWLLTEARDVHDNTITYEYTVEAGETCEGRSTQKAAYLSRIVYNGGLMRVEFKIGLRGDRYAPDDPMRCPRKFQENYRLDAIEVYVQDQLVRKYFLTYTPDIIYDDNLGDGVAKWKLALTKVQACGTNDSGQTFVCLPETTFEYYPQGVPQDPQVGRNRLKSVANGFGGKVTFTYQAVSEVSTSRNRVMRVKSYAGGWATTADTAYGYDSYGNVTSETVYGGDGGCNPWPGGAYSPATGEPRTTTIEYNSSGQGFHLFPERVTYPIGTLVETAAYDYRKGVLTSYTDANGDVTSYEYDALGRVVKVIRPGDSTTYPTVQVSYPDWGTAGLQRVVVQKREVSGQAGTVDEERYFDGLGRGVQVHLEAEGNREVVQTTLYDGLGRVQAEVVPYFVAPPVVGYQDPGSNPRTQYAYDAIGRPTQVTYPDGTKVRTYYRDWQTAVIDENNHMTIRESDAFGRMVWVKEYAGSFPGAPNWGAAPYATTNYTYEVRDLLVGVTDAAGNRTQMDYDKLGRKTAMGDPDMGSWAYLYDNLGNMTRQTDARGQRICFYYDEMSRLTGKMYRDNDTCPPPGPAYPLNVSYTYDQGTNGKGRRTRMDDASGYTTWTYDDRGRVTQESKVVNGSGTFTTQWGYGAQDQILWMKYPSGNGGGVGEQVNFGYNARLLLNSMVGTNTYVQGTTYDAAGRVMLRTMASGVLATEYTYYDWTAANGRGRLQWIRSGASAPYETLQKMEYIYDAVGNVLTIRDYNAGGTQTQSFAYDALNRLTGATASGGSEGTYEPESYTYNAIGNLTNKAGTAYTYGTQSAGCPDGALSKPHAVVAAGGNTYCYDRNGNMVKRNGGAYTLSYDAENRLTGVSGAATAAFVYDGDGNRVKGTVNGVTTVYIGDYFEWTGSTGTMKKYYYAGGQRVAMRVGASTRYFLLTDHLGSTALVTDSSGARVAEVHYKPWGEDLWTYNTLPTTYRYTGQRWEVGPGLYFYRARWYDPALGRFVQADTVVPDPGNPQNLNRYSYVLNRPLVAMDPTGHDLMIVGGCGGDFDLMQWKEWIMVYKGWTEKKFKEVYDAWKAALGRTARISKPETSC